MSRHLWLNERGFCSHVLEDAKKALAICLDAGLGVEATCRFMGYALEMKRQKGCISIKSVWAGAVKSKHRYARGINEYNYRLGGEKLFSALAGEVGLAKGAPFYMVFDRYLEGMR